MEITPDIEKYQEKLREVKNEVGKGIVGQETIVDAVLICLMCNGHVLLESVPGLAKTLLVRLLTATISDAKFQRIQFTPDLLPTDITGTTVYEEKKGFYTLKGPIFANFVLGDEINRAPPKVQSAMLQAMEERQVTIGRETFDLAEPFIVLATQNPLEQAGVYPLSVAQTDRFLFKIFVDYPPEEEEILIIDQNTVVREMEELELKKVLSPSEILEMQEYVRNIQISDEVKEYIVTLVDATRNVDYYGIKNGEYIEWGASPRASIGLSLAARATAIVNGRAYVTPEDVRDTAHNVLRHRIMLNYEGKAKGIKSDEIIDSIIRDIPVF